MSEAEALTAQVAEVLVAEVFSSVQGEGFLAGARQIFVRLRGCDLDCPYCDTPASREADGPCLAEITPGGASEELASPLTAAQTAGLVRRLVDAAGEGAHHSIAVTGGEPLLHAEFVAELAHQLRELNLPIMLETNGQRPDDLRRALAAVDIVSADFKLDSTMDRPVDAEARIAFLRLAQQRRLFVKMVITDAVSVAEIADAARQIASVDPACPVFLQPVTPTRAGISPPEAARMLELADTASRHLRYVRVMPQMHRMMGVR